MTAAATDNLELWLKAVNCSFDAQQQSGGCAIGLWQSPNIDVKYIYADKMAWSAINGDGLYGPANVLVRYGKASNCGRSEWPSIQGVIYQDVS